MTSKQTDAYNFTNWHSEIRIVTDEFAVGKWCSPWSKFSLDLDFSFMSIEKKDQESRFCIRFILRRNN